MNEWMNFEFWILSVPELRPLRQSYQESLPEYEAKKRQYESQMQMIENTITSVVEVLWRLFFLVDVIKQKLGWGRQTIVHSSNWSKNSWLRLLRRKANNSLEGEILVLKDRQDQLEVSIQQSRRHLERATEEMKLYVSGVHEKGKSARDQLQQQISEQDKVNSRIRKEHDQLKQNLPQLKQQTVDWETIERYALLVAGITVDNRHN